MNNFTNWLNKQASLEHIQRKYLLEIQAEKARHQQDLIIGEAASKKHTARLKAYPFKPQQES